jgi:L-fuculose-phosphate aldolase
VLDVLDVLRSIVAETYRSLAVHGLVLGNAGNVSVAERGSGLALITGAGLAAAEAAAEGVAAVSLADGSHRGGPAASSELPTHLVLLRAGHAAVVHSQPPHVTALGLVADEIPAVLADQAALVGGAAPVIGFAPPGTPELGHALLDALGAARRAVVIRHEGLVTVGPDLAVALAATYAVEAGARAYLLARGLGAPPALPEAEVAALRTLGGLPA